MELLNMQVVFYFERHWELIDNIIYSKYEMSFAKTNFQNYDLSFF